MEVKQHANIRCATCWHGHPEVAPCLHVVNTSEKFHSSSAMHLRVIAKVQKGFVFDPLTFTDTFTGLTSTRSINAFSKNVVPPIEGRCCDVSWMIAQGPPSARHDFVTLNGT